MQAPILINEPLLTPDMKRTRSGATQLFRKDYKDRQFTSEENADVVLRPPERHLFAELIGGQWCWVNGCAECNGKPRDWMTYIECDKHDVCRTCKTPRSQLTESPWGGKHGWQCKPCAEIEHEAEKVEALAAMPEEHDEIDYRLKVEAREAWERHIESPDQALPTGRTSRDRYIITGDKLGPST